MSYKTHPFWRVEKLLSPAKNSKKQPQFNVSVLSHHIPKTAGSSLRVAFEQALGARNVYGIYANTGADTMSKGDEIWLPSKAKVLHGHFKPHINHTTIFPNAIRTVWVRDPLERIWSLVGHLLALREKHPHYILLKSMLPKASLKSQENIVEDLVLNNTIEAFTNTYSRFFDSVPIDEFRFVGSKHRYEEGLKQLSDLTEIQLETMQVNRRTGQAHQLPSSIKRLELHLLHEYEIVGDFL
ncbi:hypothetical protein ACO1HB_13255 [Alteromonas macleodii]|uniref:hypothetical protein n=1 Tax=Alteromonas macleodii TaxID=28108 RepID=UPI002FE30DC8